jgi:hypothetical protein
VPNIVILKVYGGTIKGYGCPILSTLGSALAFSEVARVSTSSLISDIEPFQIPPYMIYNLVQKGNS